MPITSNATTTKLEHTTADVMNGSQDITVCFSSYALGNGEGGFGAVFMLPESTGTGNFQIRHRNIADEMQVTKNFGGGQATWNFTAPDNQWNLISVRYNWGNTSNRPVVFVNGEDVNATDGVVPSGAVQNPATGYSVANATSQGATWDGYLLPIVVHNIQLNDEEADAECRFPGSIGRSKPRLFLLGMRSDKVFDLSGNDFHPTLTGVTDAPSASNILPFSLMRRPVSWSKTTSDAVGGAARHYLSQMGA